jgi:hypothetical protein
VQEALRDWLRRSAEGQLARDYEAGYRAHPETRSDAEAALATASALFADDEDW